jgi:hypothetical protein
VVYVARLGAGLGCLVVLALALAPAAGAAQPVHYATSLKGTDAYIGIAKTGKCFKAYLSDGTGVATLSVWFQGCVDRDGDRLRAERGGIRLDAKADRRRASGVITLRDGRTFAFSAKGGFTGGIVGRRFKYEGRRYRSGWVVLGPNDVRWAITRIGHGLYGDPPPPPATDPCAAADSERNLLRAQLGPLLHQSGVWEGRLNHGRGPTTATYTRLSYAMSALDERISALDQQLYGC